MSSPLSMLKKTRRAPLQGVLSDQCGREKVPFRRNMSKELQASLVDDDEDEDDSFDPHPPRPCRTPASNAPTSKSKAPLKKVAPPSDFELMSSMMQRVTLLEKQVRSQAQELECKNKKISVLERKLRVQKESKSSHDLERRCRLLQNQVHEMESFLNDYGLIWVGDGETSDPAECEQTHISGRGLSQPGTSSRVRDFHMNFDLVQQRIKELNVLAGEGESFVRSTATGAQLAKKDPIQLRLYSNGIVMFDGPFRSYQEHSTQQCMKDLMDGYFPSELHERFPDGVPFEVHDRRDEEFIFRPPWEKFPGEGQAVCGKKDEPSSVASSQTLGKKLTTGQFLNRMPKAVVKGGHLIDIRDTLRATLRGSSDARSSDSVILVDTAALQAMKDRPQTFSSDRPSSARDVITLKVKSEDGNQTYVLKMRFSETIGHLRQYLDKHRGGGLLGYDIISAYPQCRYQDDCRMLRSCGLTTNAALLLKKRHY
ncbi:UBX domain-containing protein 11 isoform X2 [Scophthalmus maximus]|nr:UBX domain-containing protein 11 isoform X2 [Scophthalmus maximus]XP_047186513.1 UBX domain-containing protein 11 isoform X2 [Scophthalmus maximus]XP_047186514.1 UBX domain-containing protein 11 isoform X2 [Scophthalmus maximus]